MIELILLVIFNLLYPDKNKNCKPKDNMNTAAAFFYGTSFESVEKQRERQMDTAFQDERVHENCWDYDDWLDW